MTAPSAPRLLLASLPYRPRAFAPSFEQGGLALRLLFGIGRKGPSSGGDPPDAVRSYLLDPVAELLVVVV